MTAVDAVCGCVPEKGLQPIGAPILPGGTEAHIRRMIVGNLWIADAGDHGLLACSSHWIVPAETVRPIFTAAKIDMEAGGYMVYPTGRAGEPKVHPTGSEGPVDMIVGHMDAALAATTVVDHLTHRGLPLVAASWDNIHGGEGWAYVLDDPGIGLRVDYLNWLVGKAQPEARPENGKLCRVDEGVYRLRAGTDAGQPMAIWVEQYVNTRYISAASQKSVARRTCYVLMPVRFPKADG